MEPPTAGHDIDVPEAPAEEMHRFRRLHGIPERYLLFVGTLEPRKNRIRLLEAFERAAGSLPEIRLVVAGRTGWMDEPFQARLRASKIRDAVLLYRDSSNKVVL